MRFSVVLCLFLTAAAIVSASEDPTGSLEGVIDLSELRSDLHCACQAKSVAWDASNCTIKFMRTNFLIQSWCPAIRITRF
jgi:hypothetical protein